jgi:hypothetical protein
MSRHCGTFRWTGETGAALRRIRERAGFDAALFDRIGELVLVRFSAGDTPPAY